MPEYTTIIRQRGAVAKVLLRQHSETSVFGPFPAYLDTGASVTVVDHGAIGRLGLEAHGSTGLHVLGRDTVSHHGLYLLEISLADTDELRWIPLEALDG